MSCPCTFEPVIQVNCLFEMIKAARAGLLENKADILEHAGCTVGSLGAYLRGDDPESIFGNSAAPKPVSPELLACCDELEKALQLTQGVGERKISPETWALIVKLIMLIFSNL